MHTSHFQVPLKPQASSSSSSSSQARRNIVVQAEESNMSSERLRAMKASAFRALVGKSSTAGAAPKMTCLCAPTTHPGSFRCRMHRGNQAPSAVSHRVRSASESHPVSAPRPPIPPVSPSPPPSTHRTCSRCLVRGPSRLSKVVCATGTEEVQYDEPEIATVPIPLPVVRLHASIQKGISSAKIGARFCALRRLQGSGKDDIFRLIRPTSPRPILSI